MKIKVTQSNGLILGLSFILTLLLFSSGSQTQDLIFSVIIYILVLILFAIFLKKGNISVLSPFAVVISTIAMSYVVRPLYLISTSKPKSFFPEIAEINILNPLILSLLFLLFFLVGYFSFRNVAKSIIMKKNFPFSDVWIKKRLQIAIFLLVIITFFSYFLMVKISGMSIFSALINPFGFRLATTSQGNFYISSIALWSMWSIFYILNILFLLKLKTHKFSELIFRFIVVFFLFILLAFATIPYGSRGYILIPIIGVIWILDTFKVFRIPLSLAKLVPVLLLMILFSSSFGIFRELGLSSNKLTFDVFKETLMQGGIKNIIDGFVIRYDSFDFFSAVVDNYSRQGHDYLYGRSIIDFLVQPIPRFILSDKVYKTSAYLTQNLFPYFPKTFTPEYGLITELYINFWIPGIIFGAVLFGIIVRAIELYIKNNSHNKSFLLFYAPITLTPMGWFLAGFNSDASISFILNLFLNSILLSFITKSK